MISEKSAPSNGKLAWLFMAVFLPLLLNGFYNTHLSHTPWAYWLVDSFTWIVIPAFSIVFLLSRAERKELGLFIPTESSAFIGFIILCVTASILLYFTYTESYAWAKISFKDSPPPELASYSDIIPSNGWKHIVVNLHFAITAGIVEEIYFRGMLRRIMENIPRVFYVLSSSALFSIIHWEGGLQNLFATFAFGIVASLYALRFKSIVPLIIAHFVTNAIVLY